MADDVYKVPLTDHDHSTNIRGLQDDMYPLFCVKSTVYRISG